MRIKLNNMLYIPLASFDVKRSPEAGIDGTYINAYNAYRGLSAYILKFGTTEWLINARRVRTCDRTLFIWYWWGDLANHLV